MFSEVEIEQLKAGKPVILYQAPNKKSPRMGKFLMAIGLVGLIGYLSPMLIVEANYRLLPAPATVNAINLSVTESSKTNSAIQNFSLAIPKIRLNAPVLANIDPYNEKEYQASLKKGLAQAKGTGLPGQGETIYIFGHSSSFIWDNNPYGTAFYLLGKLEKNDKITISYNNRLYFYQVTEKKIIDNKDFTYLSAGSKEELVLQTCWPPSTNLKRLVVVAEPIESTAMWPISEAFKTF